jgi:S1-C subfamily serine protease
LVVQEGDGDLADLVVPIPAAPGVGMGLYAVDGGLQVFGVEPGSPAERAGLEMMDVVLEVDGEPATEIDVEALTDELSSMRLRVRRGDEELELSVRVQ